MTMVDERGRLWGRWNLFDVVVAVLLVGLIPLGYGAYTLFRTPAPELLKIEPTTVVRSGDMRVRIYGRNLRPYLRVSFGANQGRTFGFEDSETAVIELNDLVPGAYDVILYDYGQERARIPNGLTIVDSPDAKPAASVIVPGRFLNLAAEDVKRIQVGLKIPAGEVLEVSAPTPSTPRVFSGGVPIDVPAASRSQVPVLLRATCEIRTNQGYPECMGVSHPLRVNYLETVAVAGGEPIAFQIDDVRGDLPIVTLQARVRLTGASAALAKVQPGDVDTTNAVNPLGLGLRVLSVEPVRSTDPSAERFAVLAVRAQRSSSGWQFSLGSIREGLTIPVRTAEYELPAAVVTLQVPAR